MEEFIFDLRHVHVGRALGFTSLAFKAKVHDLVQPSAGEVRRRNAAGKHRPKSVGPAAGGMLFIFCRHVRGAHCSLHRLAANANAVAHLDGCGKSALFRKVEQSAWLPGLILWPIPEMIGERGAVYNVPRIHQVLRVEGALQFTKRLEDRGTIHALEIRAAGAPVAVLARDCPAEFHHQISDLLGDSFDLFERRFSLLVDDWTNMKAPDRAVSVVGSIGPVFCHNLAEAWYEDRQVFRINRRILDKGDGLSVPLNAHEQAEARFAQLPDRLLLIRVVGDMSAIAEAMSGPKGLESFNFDAHFRIALPRVLDAPYL